MKRSVAYCDEVARTLRDVLATLSPTICTVQLPMWSSGGLVTIDARDIWRGKVVLAIAGRANRCFNKSQVDFIGAWVREDLNILLGKSGYDVVDQDGDHVVVGFRVDGVVASW